MSGTWGERSWAPLRTAHFGAAIFEGGDTFLTQTLAMAATCKCLRHDVSVFDITQASFSKLLKRPSRSPERILWTIVRVNPTLMVEELFEDMEKAGWGFLRNIHMEEPIGISLEPVREVASSL
jgi:hypothetical protein